MERLMLLCGIDEVGRGSLAGPLLAVAALFEAGLNQESWRAEYSPILGVKDSKKFPSHNKRAEVYHTILLSPKLIDFGIGEISAYEIDKIGIDKANTIAFEMAVKGLCTQPEFILVDGTNPLYGWDMQKQRAIPKADSLYWPVGAASILAKVIRDTYMSELALDYPQYEWSKNSGYGTKEHLEVLRRIGSSPIHRTSFIKL